MGDPNVRLTSLGTIANAVEGDLTHLSNRAYKKYLANTKASAVILEKKELDYCQKRS